MRMEQLKYFLEVANSESISIAAENLFVTQPALSRNIKTLEEELGVTLFRRTVDGVHLTEMGYQLLPEIKKIVQDTDSLFLRINELTSASPKEQMQASLQLHTLPTIVDSILPESMKKFREQFPNIEFNVHIISVKEAYDTILPPKADLGIYMRINQTLDENDFGEDVVFKPLFTEGLSVVVNSEHDLAKKKSVDPSEICKYKLVAHQNSNNIESYLNNIYPVDAPLNVVLRSNNTGTITDVIINRGAMLVTHNLVIRKEYKEHPNLRIIPIKNTRGQFFVLYSANSVYKELINCLVDTIKMVRLNG